jgi:hypothetical protein
MIGRSVSAAGISCFGVIRGKSEKVRMMMKQAFHPVRQDDLPDGCVFGWSLEGDTRLRKVKKFLWEFLRD